MAVQSYYKQYQVHPAAAACAIITWYWLQ